MDSREFIEICAVAEHGGERFVRFMDRHEGGSTHEHVGRVISCDGRRFAVATEDGQHTWPMESCETIIG